MKAILSKAARNTVPKRLQRWYAFAETEYVVYLGQHEDFSGAAEAADTLARNSVWIFSEASLRHFVNSAQAATRQKRPRKKP